MNMYHLLTFFGAAPCKGGGFLGFPTWYTYLPGKTDPASGLCSPQLLGINDIWLIVAAIIEIMLRVAVLVAVGFVIYGGVNFMTSQGEPDKVARARTTLINALIGLVISVLAASIIAFIAKSIT